MQKLENNTLQIFLDRFIKELKEYNKSANTHISKPLDIPFIISSLYQSFVNKTNLFQEFIHDLCRYSDYNISILDSQNEYNGLIDVEVNLVKYIDSNDNDFYDQEDYPKYNYKLCFTYDTRDYKYCECTPDMSDYREDKQCCGHGCDASFCEFSLHKVLHIVYGSWEGDEHDYWDFEDEFYMNDKELAEKKEKEDREREIEELKNRIGEYINGHLGRLYWNSDNSYS
jgi:hypothetical protein